MNRVETEDASPRVVAWTGAVVAGGVLVVLFVGWLFWSGHPGLRRPGEVQRFTHGPDDRPDVLNDWPAIAAANREHLTTYGWIDRPAGVVRIPIDQAMKLLAAP